MIIPQAITILYNDVSSNFCRNGLPKKKKKKKCSKEQTLSLQVVAGLCFIMSVDYRIYFCSILQQNP